MLAKKMASQWRILFFIILLTFLEFLSMQPTHGQDDIIVPRVIDSVPQQYEIVKPESIITITFDQDMDQTSVESAFSISPSIQGKLNWIDATSLTFTPTEALKRGATYTVHLSTQAKSTAGSAFEDSYDLIFQVMSNLSVNQVIPAPDAHNVEAGATITVIFDQPVVPLTTTDDQATLPQPLTFSPSIQGTGEWTDTSTYVFHPTKPMPGGTLYTATLSSDLKDVDGNPLSAPFTWQFHTIPPQILYTNPQAGESQVAPDAKIQITFNQPMDQTSVISAFSVRNTTTGSSLTGLLTFNADSTMVAFQPAMRLDPDTSYQITVLAGARSAGGDATITNPTTNTFKTVDFPKLVQTSPADGTQVAPNCCVYLEFNNVINDNNLSSKIHIVPHPDPVTVSCCSTQITLNFNLLPATTYTISLDAGIKDMYGNVTQTAYKLTIRTKSEGDRGKESG